MAEFLRSGHTMLNMACPVCNNPIFRDKNGDKYCPICNKRVLIIKNESQQKVLNPKKIDDNNYKFIENNQVSLNNVLISFRNIIIKKIDWLSKKLEEETDIDLIKKILKLLLYCYDIINKSNNLINSDKL